MGRISSQSCSGSGHFVVLDFHLNDNVYDSVVAGDTANNVYSSKTKFVSLKKANSVYLKHEQTGDYLKAYS